MAIKQILTIPNKILVTKCASTPIPWPEELERDLIDTLEAQHDPEGLGLAAPQIGVLTRMIAVKLSQVTGAGKILVMGDPEIISEATFAVPGIEACLSIPGFSASITRPTVIDVRWSYKDYVQYAKLTGLDARIVQHEIDHLNGILISDRAQQENRRSTRKSRI